MPKQVVSLMLALLYLSVSLFAAGHVHDDHHKSLSHQCVACAWHFEAQTDIPTGPSLISVPLIVVIPANDAEVSVFSSPLIARSDRGPPIHS